MGLVTDVVGAIECLVTLMAQFVAEGVVTVVNLVIVAAAAALAAIAAVMPNMPSWPVNGGDWSWLNWFLPVSGIVTLFGTGVTLVLVWLGMRVAMNWLKAL